MAEVYSIRIIQMILGKWSIVQKCTKLTIKVESMAHIQLFVTMPLAVGVIFLLWCCIRDTEATLSYLT